MTKAHSIVWNLCFWGKCSDEKFICSQIIHFFSIRCRSLLIPIAFTENKPVVFRFLQPTHDLIDNFCFLSQICPHFACIFLLIFHQYQCLLWIEDDIYFSYSVLKSNRNGQDTFIAADIQHYFVDEVGRGKHIDSGVIPFLIGILLSINVIIAQEMGMSELFVFFHTKIDVNCFDLLVFFFILIFCLQYHLLLI